MAKVEIEDIHQNEFCTYVYLRVEDYYQVRVYREAFRRGRNRVNVLVVNSSARAWKMRIGRFFSGFEAAAKGYKNPKAKAAIERARQILESDVSYASLEGMAVN